MHRFSLRSVATRLPVGTRISGVRVPATRTWAPSLLAPKHVFYSTTRIDKNGKIDGMLSDFPPKGLDVDALEAHMKYLTGDYGTWDHEKLKQLSYNDCLLPAVTWAGFADYAVCGMRPDGGKPSFPLMTAEEVGLVEIPYNDWAPKPYRTLSYSCTDKIMPMYSPEDVGSEDSPWVWMNARLHVLRAKLWHGMVPLSHERWLDKKLDDPKNYRMFFEIMQDILSIFEWLNREETLERMRQSFNKVVNAYAEFGRVANLRREQMRVKEKLDLAGMWVEYYQAILSTMCNRTYQWLVDRVEEVQNRAFEDYTAALEKAGDDQEAIGLAGKAFFECLQDLNALMTRADQFVAVSMPRFNGYDVSNSIFDQPLAIRQDTWRKIADTKDWSYVTKIFEAKGNDSPENLKPMEIQDYEDEMKNGPKPAPPRFRDSEAFIGFYHEGKRNRAEIRKEFRGELKPLGTIPAFLYSVMPWLREAANEPRFMKSLGEEHWVTVLKERNAFYLKHGKEHETWNHKWGFVCYRLTYDQSDEEWANFKKKFETDVFRSGQWIEGYDTIADKAGIEYIDERDVGIPRGDIEAAKKHFTSTYTVLPTLGRLWTSDFLVIDQQCCDSHIKPPLKDIRPPPPYGPCFGDLGGYVRLIDTKTDEYAPEFTESIAPGYTGNMKVLSNLLLEEVYPLLAVQALRPTGLWPLARLHPSEVYVGHTVQAQEGWWEWERVEKANMQQRFFEHLRSRQGGKAKEAKAGR